MADLGTVDTLSELRRLTQFSAQQGATINNRHPVSDRLRGRGTTLRRRQGPPPPPPPPYGFATRDNVAAGRFLTAT
ncbi:hypothetical protein MCOR27_005032 [Pyricularia oryzae]|uniref:Uncharacterized protein n=1 Tax=Pyricularia grisea TaxID=148305 RepID=A0ABQ8NYX4_PYRGI|nr:hypothetical protein MCOR19_001815 [Pyricularia oryzae]KAI6303178.1 hypothetical protein MCOR33_001626 [Pyricularia grisea]KAI6279698.1 hypothetical protein MCOR27_005032 [Pyricularia oryzae]KAI6332305.1 hypothetical protein MCOR30_004609 [Pyricularia oryzae]KAI6394120.1 hypothetical protein MCOR20_010627 [Pyricularia oryzae]